MEIQINIECLNCRRYPSKKHRWRKVYIKMYLIWFDLISFNLKKILICFLSTGGSFTLECIVMYCACGVWITYVTGKSWWLFDTYGAWIVFQGCTGAGKCTLHMFFILILLVVSLIFCSYFSWALFLVMVSPIYIFCIYLIWLFNIIRFIVSLSSLRGSLFDLNVIWHCHVVKSWFANMMTIDSGLLKMWIQPLPLS